MSANDTQSVSGHSPCDPSRGPTEIVRLPLEDYRKLITAAEADDMLYFCETCGAWLLRDDPAAATTEDYQGCWKIATGNERDKDLCRAYRSTRADHFAKPECKNKFTAEEVEIAARAVSGQIISMIMWGCQRRRLNGMPMVNDEMVGWNEYIALTVRSGLDVAQGIEARSAEGEGNA